MSKNILITGSNGGIGLAITNYLLEKGYRNLACQYRSENSLISKLLTAYDLNPEKHLYKAELTNENEVRELREKIENNIGKIYALVNVAGMSKNSMSWNISQDEFSSVINNNLLITFLCSKEFIPQMRHENCGRIINFSSVVADMGVVGASHYSAAKAGINGLTKSLSLELANKNITVNSIALGYFEYGLINEVPEKFQNEIKQKIPAKRFGNKEDIGSLVEYLLNDNSSYVTGQSIRLNGGLY
ncbi:SDR family oxidoreductase [bacterium]|nr:SDR family oxidoreductase [bacterium]